MSAAVDRRAKRHLLALTGALLAALAALAVTFALPVETWRTGRLSSVPLALVPGGPAVSLPARVWIDTDAACGAGRTTDPDDCLALLLLLRAPGLDIAGVSTVFGNAAVDVTHEVARELAARIGRPHAVHRGASAPGEWDTPASRALAEALTEGPLTVVALGPLTNVATALRDRENLRGNVARLIAVMGRRPGHLFHPAEGAQAGLLFGHGPVFRDFNYAMDRAATQEVVAWELPLTLIPYDVGRTVSIVAADLDRLRAAGDAPAWVATRSRAWLDYWMQDIGRPGFYPFDLLAAAYVIDPTRFDCAHAAAWIGPDNRLWHLPFQNREALLAGVVSERTGEVRASASAVYCTGVRPGVPAALIDALSR